jgi:hypothetical protein
LKQFVKLSHGAFLTRHAERNSSVIGHFVLPKARLFFCVQASLARKNAFFCGSKIICVQDDPLFFFS